MTELLIPCGAVIFYTADPTEGMVPLTVQFTAPGVDSGGIPVTNWNWAFGDGTTSTAQNPLHTYTTTGAFSASLIATNTNGATVLGIGPPINVSPGFGLVQNGGFATGDFTDWTQSGNISYSYVNNGSQNGIMPYLAGDVAVFGPSGSPGYISQTLPTIPGAVYLLSFLLDSPDGMIPNEFLVSWNGITLLDTTNLPAFGWTNLQFLVKATGTGMLLQFGFRDDPTALALENVSVMAAQPGITGLSLSGTNLVVNGINGLAGLTYGVLMSTNLAQPLSQWTPVATNTLNADGNFTITATNAVTPNAAQRFYILNLQ